MLLEQHALVRHVLVDDPQALRVHRDDEARIDLPQRLEVRDALGTRGWNGGLLAGGLTELLSKLRMRSSEADLLAGFKMEALWLGLEGRSGQLEPFSGPDAIDRQRRWDHRAQRSGSGGTRGGSISGWYECRALAPVARLFRGGGWSLDARARKRGDGPGASQRRANRVAREVVHKLRVPKAHLDLRRVDIHIHFLIGHLEE